jgi:GAF domain-containing protein
MNHTTSTMTVSSALDVLGRIDRLTEVARYDLCDPALRIRLDAVCGRTARRLGTPIALVTVLLDRAELFAGNHGMTGWPADVGGLPAEWAFSARLVRDRTPYVVSDAAIDPVHKSNPVVGTAGVRSYACVPLVVPSGHVIGGLCVVDTTARTFGIDDVAALEEAADDVVALLNAQRSESGPVAG